MPQRRSALPPRRPVISTTFSFAMGASWIVQMVCVTRRKASTGGARGKRQVGQASRLRSSSQASHAIPSHWPSVGCLMGAAAWSRAIG